jgi:hypothetical protein
LVIFSLRRVKARQLWLVSANSPVLAQQRNTAKFRFRDTGNHATT